MKRKIAIILIAFVLSTTSGLSIITVSAGHAFTSFDDLTADTNDSHIIEGVPYVGQNKYSCAYASLTMIFRYYGHNVTLEDVLHNSGVGYSIAFSTFGIPGFIENRGIPMAGTGIVQNPFNIKYLASLYGLKLKTMNLFDSIIPASEEQKWDSYWLNTKKYIKENIPVQTSVDPCSLPFYIENYKIPKEIDHAAHSVVIIGFNESNNTVCINDPGPFLFNDSKNGTYVFLSKNVFKNAVKNTIASKYLLLTYEPDYSKTVLTENEIFEICHKKNIEKMEGKIGSYIGTSTGFTLPILGINALKKYKKNLEKPLLRLLIIKKLSNINPRILNHSFNFLSLEKQNISKYLYQKRKLSYFCEYDAFLLEQESECCKKLHQYNLELYEMSKNNNLLKVLFSSKELFIKMIDEINLMINIEQKIIENPVTLGGENG